MLLPFGEENLLSSSEIQQAQEVGILLDAAKISACFSSYNFFENKNTTYQNNVLSIQNLIIYLFTTDSYTNGHSVWVGT